MTIKKLTAMSYAQAHIEIDEKGNVYLFSYVTCVASIDSDGWLTIYGLHSQTTRRHIGCFVRESIYNDGYKLNIHTGEIVEI